MRIAALSPYLLYCSCMVYRPVRLLAVCQGLEMFPWRWGRFGVHLPHPTVCFSFQFVERNDQKLGFKKRSVECLLGRACGGEGGS